MKKDIDEKQFKEVVFTLFPHHVSAGFKDETEGYFLDPHKLMNGGYRIGYWNPCIADAHITGRSSEGRTNFLDVIDEDYILCLLFMRRELYNSQLCWQEITKEAYDKMNEKWQSEMYGATEK